VRSPVRRSGFAAVAALAALATLAFLLVPVVAVFADVGPGRLLAALGETSVREALLLSLKTSPAGRWS
jgi:molybdate transport system permease protein